MAINQISVFLENRAGQLSEITELLYQNNIDLRAINIAETSDYGVLRLIADDEKRAFQVLNDAGFVCSMGEVYVVGVPDKPGGLSVLLKRLAEANIDIAYMYSIFSQKDGTAYIVFRVKNDENVEAIMEEYNIELADTASLCLEDAK